MKMKFRYLYDRFQEVLIKRLQEETDAKFRIRADRTIEFAKKWYPVVYEKIAEIRFDIFVKPLIRTWGFWHNAPKRGIPNFMKINAVYWQGQRI